MRGRANWLRAVAVTGFLLELSGATARAEGYPGRPDAPAMPKKGEYQWAEPKDWTPPSLEELQKWEWKDGRITTARELAATRYAAYKPGMSDAEALAFNNDSKEANERILAVLSRPPKSDDEVDWDATVNRVLDGAPSMLNYVLYSTRYENYIGLMDTALAFTFDYQLIPFADSDYVREWKRNPMAELVRLRDDMTWEDGTPFTAYDIEFTYHVIMDDRVNVPAVRSETEQLKWVKAYDATTLVYFHKEPKASNIWIVQFPILPKHIYSPGLADDPTIRTSEWNTYWNFHPLSSGPYRVVSHTAGQEVLMERRDDWYLDKSGKQVRAKPYVKTMRFRIIPEENAKLLAFKKGEVDEFLSNPRQWASETGDAAFREHGVKVSGVEWGYRYIGWNQKPVPDAPFFKDKRVRTAMTYALNHKELIEEITFGLYDYGQGHFHPQSWMGHPDVKPFAQDLDKAEALLDEDGLIHGKGGTLNRVRKELGPDLPRWLGWIRALPTFLRFEGWILVHAGIAPGKTPEQCTRAELTRIREVDGGPWFDSWQGPEIVVFGHWATLGKVDKPLAKGLDTGCVYGGRLTGLWWPRLEWVSVPARRQWYDWEAGKPTW